MSFLKGNEGKYLGITYARLFFDKRTWITQNRGGSNLGQILQDNMAFLSNIGFNPGEPLQRNDLKIHNSATLNKPR